MMFQNKCLFLLTLVGVMFSINQSNAQDYNSFGVRLGLNSSNLFAEVPDETNKKIDFSITGFYKIHITEELIYFQPELGLSRMGSSMKLNDTEYNLNLSYIQMPLLLSIGQKNISFVEIGGYLNYLVHADLNNKQFMNLNTNDLNKLDYGIALGLNANYENFAIGLRYYYGLANIGNESMEELIGKRARNSVFQVYLTYTFL